MRAVLLAPLVLAGCAGAPGPTAVVLGDSAAEAGASVQSRAAAPDSILTIGANVRGITLLGWLADHGFIEGEPWAKLFSEPPMTGPRAGVDTTRYVDFFRQMCDRIVVSWDSTGCQVMPFSSWPADSQVAFARREWRCGLFNQCGEAAECVCDGQRWEVFDP